MNSICTSHHRRSIFSLFTAFLVRNDVATDHHRLRLFSTQPTFLVPIRPIQCCNRRHYPSSPPPPPQSHQNPDYTGTDFARISSLLTESTLQPGPDLEEALTAAQISLSPNLLLEVFNHFDSSPKPLFTLFEWAEKQPDYRFSRPVFNAVVNSLGKGREFDSAWRLIRGRVDGDASERPDFDTFAIMIRRYVRAGNPLAAITTFKYASDLDISHDLDLEKNLFGILLDSLCKEGHVREASDFLDKHRAENQSWSPPIQIYNMLLNGWFRLRKIKKAEWLWEQMKKEKMKPTVVSYGTLVEGLCRMRRPDMALDLLNEMKLEGVEPNAIVYNPIIDALGEDGRFKEALGMLERFSILESGPTISTYNSLVKGLCKAGDLLGASKILSMMLNKKCVPTTTTYNYFMRYFTKLGKSDEGLNLYTKMIKCGYDPDRLTYHMLVKLLCKEGKLDLSMKIIAEMRARGCDLDLSASTMLIHLLYRMSKYDEAVAEFEDMIRRGLVPQYLTYQKMSDGLRKQGFTKMAQKLYDLMSSVPHSTKLPDTYKGEKAFSNERKTSILQKAEAMSRTLKASKNPRWNATHRKSVRNAAK